MTGHIESNWVVLKFGGTSVSSVSNWKNVADVVRERLDEGRPSVHRALRAVGHHRPARATARQGAVRRLGTGDGADRAPAHGPRARPRHSRCRRRTRPPFHRTAAQRRRHPPDRRGQRSPARARDGQRRTDGDAARRGVPRARRHRRAMARCAHDPARGRASRRHRALPTTCRRPATSSRTRRCSSAWRDRQARRDHAGLHRQRRARRHGAARSRRLRHLGQLLRGEAARAAPRDLDRRARHVHVESALGAECAAAQVARLRRGAGNREQRRQGAAPALHPAGEAVRDPADRSTRRSSPTSRAPS